jgi:hypothetical protein
MHTKNNITPFMISPKTIVAILCVCLGTTSSFAQAYRFCLERPEKDTFVYRIHEIQEVVFASKDEEKTNKEEKTVDYQFRINQVNAKKDMNVTVTIKDIYFKRETEQDVFEFDAKNPTTHKGIESKAYKKLLNKHFGIKISPKGAVLTTQRLPNSEDDFLQTADIFEMPNIEVLRDSIKNQINNATFESTMRYFAYTFVPDSLKIGTSWTVVDTLYPSFGVLAKMTYTLKDVKNDIAFIDIKADLEEIPDFRGLDLDIMHLKFSLSGMQEGVLLLDTKTGWIRKMNLIHSLRGKMTVFFIEPQGVVFKTTIKGATDFDLINY